MVDRTPIEIVTREPAEGGSDNLSNTKYYVIGIALALIAVTAFLAFR
ncbi:hypothetical protein [Bradyrhizobium ottawaense]|uniref:Uncharacterized protein n=1 Tax=Bradyrhizobium ottawaense TaxID=931866 RepID=A0ABY0QHD1_9BRAD|nr:hypothetical protein [Bradyrhizobium ottawaense]SDK41983.1 hypothetical protein SAMN05444163_8067 [Bradyrhizobium ottawaense]